MSRKLTEKGKAYNEERRRTSCKSTVAKIQKLRKKIELNSREFDNVHLVQSDLDTVYQLSDELKERYELWMVCLDEEPDVHDAHSWYESVRHDIEIFVAGIKDWIAVAKNQLETDLTTPSEKGSLVSGSRYSRTSAARERLAELMTQSALLEKKQALRNQMERLEIDEKIAIAKAREQVLTETGRQSMISLSKTVPTCLPSRPRENFEDTSNIGAITFPRYLRPGRDERLRKKEEREAEPATPIRTQPTPPPNQVTPIQSSIATKVRSNHRDCTSHNRDAKPKIQLTPTRIADTYSYVRNVKPKMEPILMRTANTYQHPREAKKYIDTPPRPSVIDHFRNPKDTEFIDDETSPKVPPRHRFELPFFQDQPDSVYRHKAETNEVTMATFLDRQNRLTEILSEQHQRSLLPPLTLASFTNDPADYITFISNFESQIETTVRSSEVRLRYLEQYLVGDAKELIKGCKFKDPEHGYPEAKKLLKEKYGDPYKIANAYIKKAADWPVITAGNDAELDQLSTFLTQCVSAMQSISYLHILDHPQNLQNLMKKLPSYLQERWRRKVIDIRESTNQLPGFKNLADFLKIEAKIATDPVFSKQALAKTTVKDQQIKTAKSSNFQGRRTYRVTSNATNVGYHATKQVENSPQCALCEVKGHDLDDCRSFKEKSLEERKKFLAEKHLCYGCFTLGHRSRGCLQKRQCGVCSKRHPTSLHDYNFQGVPNKTSDSKQEDTVKNARIAHKDTVHHVEADIKSMPIVPVKLRYNNEVITTYAMLDNCSTGTFVSESALKRLKIEGASTKIAIKTINGTKLLDTKVITGLVVSDLQDKNYVSLPKAFSRDEIPATKGEIPRPGLARQWPHLQLIADQIPPIIHDAQVDLLIGTNCPKALQPKDFVTRKEGGPYAMLTFAGWTIIGPVKAPTDIYTISTECASRILTTSVCKDGTSNLHFKIESSVKEIVKPETLNKLLDAEFHEAIMTQDNERTKSVEDTRFLQKMEKETQLVNGHYQMPLPFKDDDATMPDNKKQVMQNMKWLQRKLLKDTKLHQDYKAFMFNVIDKDYARRIPTDLLEAKPRKTWYIPHHAVYHPHKPNKIRVVFNCSAKFNGVSLNDKLMQGPDLTNSLVGVLTRFRRNPIAFTGDLDAMFYQVRVKEDDRDFLRFLWWPNGNLNCELQEYQMNVHLFGAVSSPSCANLAIKKIADEFEEQIGTETANTLRKNFYVDDCLRSEETEEAAIERVHGVINACSKGGFSLSKITSNRKAVLQTIPPEKRSEAAKRIDLGDNLPIERVLGVQWCVGSDELGFRITLKDKPPTRRGILATISSVYDPLGIAAPVILQGKRVLQELCISNTNWDDQIPEESKMRWERWRKCLPKLEDFAMRRSLKPENFGSVSQVQIHNFSDASLTGYGEVSYLRQINEHGDIHCAFLMGKARLVPLKAITIPRLELTAAVLSVRIGSMLKGEFDVNIDDSTFWTDSTTVLKYLNNNQNRYKIFVANRIQTIIDNSEPRQWKYVEGRYNPADDASRGLEPTCLNEQHRWITGPEFLWKPESMWPKKPVDIKVCLEDPDVKEIICSSSTADHPLNVNEDLLQRWSYFSDWYHLKKAVAHVLRLQAKYRKNSDAQITANNQRWITQEDLANAEKVIVKVVQKHAFAKEIVALESVKNEETNNRVESKQRKREIKKTSSLFRLDPFLDKDGIIRVGGRLRKAQDLPDNLKHPAILPKKGHVTELVIRNAHEKTAHSGRGITLNELRNNFWVINANSMVRWFIAKCVVCRRLRARLESQRMANLPEDRVTPAPPFTFCAVDYFGPCTIKEGRKELKRYGVLFTCLTSRAIHLESAISLTTDSFINALRRFLARRGPIKTMRSDQGTNLVGAVNELKENFKKMDQTRIAEYLLRHGNANWLIDWKFNPPAASHMGGIWERLIRTVRSILVALTRDYGHAINDESFRTLLVEVENIVNSRPLTFPTDDPQDLTGPLTPNHLLSMKAKVVLPPPGNFQRDDMYSTKQWKRVQSLIETFWARWKREYLQSLQEPKKWNRPRRNLAVGDIVLITDERTPRNSWPLARVIEVYPDAEGLVRTVKIKTPLSVFTRPIHKLVLLLEH